MVDGVWLHHDDYAINDARPAWGDAKVCRAVSSVGTTPQTPVASRDWNACRKHHCDLSNGTGTQRIGLACVSRVIQHGTRFLRSDRRNHGADLQFHQ